MPSAGLPQVVTVRPHMPSSTQIQCACYKKWKVEWEAQTGMCRWSTFTFENSCGCTALDMPEWRETTEQILRLAGKATLTNGLPLLGREVLRSLRRTLPAGTKPRTSHRRPSGGERREKARGSARRDYLPAWKDERGPSSIRRTLEPFQRLGKLLRDGIERIRAFPSA